MADEREHLATCACGALRVAVRGAPDAVVACNCTECQRRTGSPFGVGAYYSKSAIVSIDGAANSFERVSDAGRTLTNKFCPECGTSVYWTLDRYPDRIGIAVGCFADPTFVPPARVVFAKNQHHWVSFPDDIPSFPEGTS